MPKDGDFDLFDALSTTEPVLPKFEDETEALIKSLSERPLTESDLKEVLTLYTRELTKFYKAVIKEQDEKFDILKEAIFSLKKLFLYNSFITVGPEPVKPQLADFTRDCKKCGGMGFIPSESRYCECRLAYNKAFDTWREDHRKWEDTQGTAARRSLRNENDVLASQGKERVKASSKKKSRYRPVY